MNEMEVSMADVEDRIDLPTKPIPEPTLRRLPLYYQYLKKVRDEQKGDFISCTQIGNDLSILPIQVRKDLGIAEAVGKPKLGYSIDELISIIEAFLGWNTEGAISRCGISARPLGSGGSKSFKIIALRYRQGKIGRHPWAILYMGNSHPWLNAWHQIGSIPFPHPPQEHV